MAAESIRHVSWHCALEVLQRSRDLMAAESDKERQGYKQHAGFNGAAT